MGAVDVNEVGNGDTFKGFIYGIVFTLALYGFGGYAIPKGIERVQSLQNQHEEYLAELNKEGYDAAYEHNIPPSACPYDDGYKRNTWVQGWTRGRIDYLKVNKIKTAD